MRKYSAILGNGARSWALVVRLAREFIRPHARRLALAAMLMGVAAASTASRAWLMQPVLDRMLLARDGRRLYLRRRCSSGMAAARGPRDCCGAVCRTCGRQ